jgi:hypothetical protein
MGRSTSPPWSVGLWHRGRSLILGRQPSEGHLTSFAAVIAVERSEHDPKPNKPLTRRLAIANYLEPPLTCGFRALQIGARIPLQGH